MPSKLKRCPSCDKKGWYKDAEGVHRCRYCGQHDGAQVAAKRLQRELDKGHRALGRVIERERQK